MSSKLIYSVIASLDGFVADPDGNFDWAAPDEELHAFVNDRERPIGTYLFGRKMYETMKVWEHPASFADASSPVIADFARIWQAADKVVYSTTLDAVSSARTRIERSFDADAVTAMKASAERDISIGGPHLAARAIAAGLVDEIQLFLHPVVRGSGNGALPPDVRIGLELLDERRFASGVVYLRYAVRPLTG